MKNLVKLLANAILLQVIILGALVGAIITLLAIIILFLMRPKVLTREETKQILQIPSDKKQLKKLLSVEVWHFSITIFDDMFRLNKFIYQNFC